MEPPPCIQNAMLTKDKKPFTYTPGGLNLSEIRSPRMARRIERNAAYEGVQAPPPQPNRPQIQTSSLPPSTLAALQPQMHVQVFPSGPPPPPPMMKNNGIPVSPPPSNRTTAPPPPPPLPTQKIRTPNQQIIERPDMTKIIPENPMAMLKRTGGPKIKNTLLNEIYNEPVAAQQMSSPPPAKYQNNQPTWQNNQKQQASSNIPNVQNWNQGAQTNASVIPPWSNTAEPPRTPPNVSRNWNQQPEKNVNVGSIYIPPLNTQQPPSVQSPKTPGTPILKEAPKPWQQKQHQKQDEAPEWVRKQPVKNDEPSPVPFQQNQSEWRRTEMNPQMSPRDVQREPNYSPNYAIKQPEWARREPNSPQSYPQTPSRLSQSSSQFDEPKYPEAQPFVRHQRYEVPPQPNPAGHPNAVFVTQPVILQHPGTGYGPPLITRREHNAQSPVKREGVGEIIIPIRVEGNSPEPSNQNRGVPRNQPAWGGNNSFSSQPGVEVTGKEHPLEMTNRLNRQVPHESGGQNRGPQVRNIPIQIEGDDGGNRPQAYVPPSQQGPAEEPRKYMGGSIPSRSFRMLQAMTAPDSCANANKDANWTYPAYYAMYPPPPYFFPPPSTDRSNSDPDLNNKKLKNPIYPTPPPYLYPPTDRSDSDPELVKLRRTPTSRCSSVSELENINNNRTTPVPPYFYTDSGRNTPVPYWYYQPDGGSFYPPYPPYYDPYFFSYYYNYPPIYSPLPYVNSNTDTEEANGYSSMDEMTYYTEKSQPPPAKTEGISIPPQIDIKITPPPPSSIPEELDSDTETVNENQESEEEETDSMSGSISPSPTDYEDDENVPHQLSVIFEVSETTSRNTRGSSVASDSTLKSEDEDEENEIKSSWYSGNLMEIASRINNVINSRIEGDDLRVENNDSKQHCLIDLNENRNCRKKISEESTGKQNLETSSCDDSKDHFVEYIFKVPKKTKTVERERGESSTFANEELSNSSVIEKKFLTGNKREIIQEEHRDVFKENIQSRVTERKIEEPSRSKNTGTEIELIETSVSPKEDTSIDIEERDSLKHEESSSESEDFWKILGKDEEDDLPRKKSTSYESSTQYEEKKVLEKVPITSPKSSSDESSSESSETDSDEEEVNDVNNNSKNDSVGEKEEKVESEDFLPIPTIKDRIRALQESIAAKKKKLSCPVSVNEEEQLKNHSAKSSFKSFDEISEEDSGVTDMSKEEEEFPELKKMSRYQRASTHSRLFELLQGECGEEEENDEETENDETHSQISFKMSTSNDKLADELVRSLLKQKKCAVFRQLSSSKLYAAAKKILQTAENERSEMTTPSEGFSEFVSPQEFYYNEYAAYYDTWAKATAENLTNAKCPRIVHSDLNQSNPRLPKS